MGGRRDARMGVQHGVGRAGRETVPYKEVLTLRCAQLESVQPVVGAPVAETPKDIHPVTNKAATAQSQRGMGSHGSPRACVEWDVGSVPSVVTELH